MEGDPGSRSACRGAARNDNRRTLGRSSTQQRRPGPPRRTRPAPAARLERRRVAREEAPREAQGVHVDAVCFARAPRDDEQPAAADEQVVRLAVQQIEVVQQQRVGPQQRVGEGAVRREVLRANQSVSRVDGTPSPRRS